MNVVVLDLRHICQNMEQFGHGKGTIYGGCSEYTIVPSKYAYLLKSDIDDAKAAILERKCMHHAWQCSQVSKCILCASALGVAHQALEEINPSGDNILIQGIYETHIGI